jgi:hypothetical protein
MCEGILIFLQWYYINYFITQKKIRLQYENKSIKTKTKVLFYWLYLVLLMNTFSVIVYNVCETVLSIVDINSDKKSLLLLELNRFSMFWFDTLNLSNGIIFVLLFRSMVQARGKNRHHQHLKKSNSI